MSVLKIFKSHKTPDEKKKIKKEDKIRAAFFESERAPRRIRNRPKMLASTNKTGAIVSYRKTSFIFSA
ncbi:MAG: hypothetical protein IH795_02200 [Bacteroidetes bacterium]|nr:hypothetical protein [Bacteroidota bacterium]